MRHVANLLLHELICLIKLKFLLISLPNETLSQITIIFLESSANALTDSYQPHQIHVTASNTLVFRIKSSID